MQHSFFWLFQHFSHGETKIIMMWMPDGDVDDIFNLRGR